MDTRDHRHYAQALSDEESRLRSLMDALRDKGLGMPQTLAVAELSSYDQHPADQGAETFEREKDVGLMASTLQQLDDVQRARERLERGTYGWCEECGHGIDPARLQALPSAALCLPCKEAQESMSGGYHRPVEEEVLSSPFYRTRLADTAAIDGDDVWEALARYGTANSPQDTPPSDPDWSPDRTPGDVAEPELDDGLWHYIQETFQGNPEMEMAEELSPQDLQDLALEYENTMRDERAHQRSRR